jgi:hypothetical protein
MLAPACRNALMASTSPAPVAQHMGVIVSASIDASAPRSNSNLIDLRLPCEAATAIGDEAKLV